MTSLEVTSRVASFPVPFRLAQCTVDKVLVAHIDSLEVSSLCPFKFALDFSIFLINFTEKNEKVSVILSLHSFNPIFKNKRRTLEFGILSNEDKNLSNIIIDQLRFQKLNVGDNMPYKGNLIGDTMYRHGLRNKLPHALIEVRNDLLSNPTKIKRVSRLLHKTIVASLKKLAS